MHWKNLTSSQASFIHSAAVSSVHNVLGTWMDQREAMELMVWKGREINETDKCESVMEGVLGKTKFMAVWECRVE